MLTADSCMMYNIYMRRNMIRLGPAGSSGLGNIEGLRMVKKLGLKAMEVEFTYGVRMSVNEAKKVGRLASELGISLSVHAPYYINLASYEPDKVAASKKRILDSCERAHYMSASPVVFHAGFYQGRSSNETYEIIKNEISALNRAVADKKWRVGLAPETTGKKSQFGSLDELMRLSRETGCGICVDFAHLLARDGSIDYGAVLGKLKPLKRVHAHFSGIEYTAKGERRHVPTKPKDIRTLLGAAHKSRLEITIINESPFPIQDSAKSAKILGALVRGKR